MAKLLDSVITTYIRQNFPDDSEADRYSAQKMFEEKLVQEVCEEQSDLISKKAQEKEKLAKFDSVRSELRKAFVQCVVLAVLIGLLVNAVSDLVGTLLYGASGSFEIVPWTIYTLVVATLAVAVFALIAFSYIREIVTEYFNIKIG